MPFDEPFWTSLYREGADGWELGEPAPPLARWIAGHPITPGARALVVGCGRGHEARLAAAAGAQVTAIDIAPVAIDEARACAAAEGLQIDWQVRDLFALSGDPFDLVIEHCCFCAIDPALRPDYVRVVADMLVPGGELLGLFRVHGRGGGPPFDTSEAELRALFTPRFTCEHLEIPADSVPRRAGQELLAVWRKRRD